MTELAGGVAAATSAPMLEKMFPGMDMERLSQMVVALCPVDVVAARCVLTASCCCPAGACHLL